MAVFVTFLIATAPHFTGIAIHEWLSVAFAAAIVTHLLSHWCWIVAVRESSWRNLYSLSSNAALLLVGLHVALHWRWIVANTKRILLRPRRNHALMPYTTVQEVL